MNGLNLLYQTLNNNLVYLTPVKELWDIKYGQYQIAFVQVMAVVLTWCINGDFEIAQHVTVVITDKQ